MESESSGREHHKTSAQLDLIAADRRELARRIVRPPWWYIPASTLMGVTVVASPLTGSVWSVTMIASIAGIILSGIERANNKKLGITIVRPVGPKSLSVALGLGVVFLALFVISVVLMVAGAGIWIALTAAGASLLVPLGLLLLDRATASEIMNAR